MTIAVLASVASSGDSGSCSSSPEVVRGTEVSTPLGDGRVAPRRGGGLVRARRRRGRGPRGGGGPVAAAEDQAARDAEDERRDEGAQPDEEREPVARGDADGRGHPDRRGGREAADRSAVALDGDDASAEEADTWESTSTSRPRNLGDLESR